MTHWYSLINEFMWTVRENVQLPMGSAWTSVPAPYFMRSGGRDEGLMGDTSLFLNLVNQKKGTIAPTWAHSGTMGDWFPSTQFQIELACVWGSQWSNAQEAHSSQSWNAASVLLQHLFHMLTSDIFILFLVLWGNPTNDIEMEWERQRELNVLLGTPHPPTRSILAGPGGEPDGAEQSLGVQGVGGRY